MSKYDPLKKWLTFEAKGNKIILSFSQIEGILGFSLPQSAYDYRQWWENSVSHTQAKAWLAAGWKTYDVDMKNHQVPFFKTGLTKVYSKSNDEDLIKMDEEFKDASEFEKCARIKCEEYFAVKLSPGKIPPVPKVFDMKSDDNRIVGDAKLLSMVRGKKNPAAKFSNIAEHIWMLEKMNAEIKFLVFGNDKRVPIEWLKRYGNLIDNVLFFFLASKDSDLEKIN